MAVATRTAQPTRSPARRPVTRSSIGLKILMAATGLLLAGFLYAHMIGNLKIFFGEHSFDSYAHWLRDILTPLLPHGWYLWIQRGVLLFAVLGHIAAATVLTARARRARPVRYAHRRPVQGSYAARTMRWGGVIVALFVIYHLLDLTTGHLNPVGDPSRPYAQVAADFAPERWYVTAFYVLAILAIGVHLRHGLWSAVQTLGLSNRHRERALKGAALALTILLCGGFLSVPLAVTVGWVS